MQRCHYFVMRGEIDGQLVKIAGLTWVKAGKDRNAYEEGCSIYLSDNIRNNERFSM